MRCYKMKNTSKNKVEKTGLRWAQSAYVERITLCAQAALLLKQRNLTLFRLSGLIGDLPLSQKLEERLPLGTSSSPVIFLFNLFY